MFRLADVDWAPNKVILLWAWQWNHPLSSSLLTLLKINFLPSWYLLSVFLISLSLMYHVKITSVLSLTSQCNCVSAPSTTCSWSCGLIVKYTSSDTRLTESISRWQKMKLNSRHLYNMMLSHRCQCHLWQQTQVPHDEASCYRCLLLAINLFIQKQTR